MERGVPLGENDLVGDDELGASEHDDHARRGDALTALLAPYGLGPVEWVPDTESTNADLLDAARVARSGTVKITDHQTAGRGRLDRSWKTVPDAALLMSVLLRLTPDAEQLARANAALGIAACQAVRDLGIPGIGLKWPNDLVVDTPDQPKVAGVLAQGTIGHEDATVVVGIGCNVRSDGLGELVPERPTAALSDVGEPPDRVRLAAEILRRLDPQRSDLWDRYRRLSVTIGTDVVVQTTTGTITGRADDIADGGALVVRDDDEVVEVLAGDVTSVRRSNDPTR